MREIEKHVYFYDTMVIGGNLPAFIYAYTNSLPIIFVDGKPPFEFDRFGKEEDLSFLQSEKHEIETHIQAWSRIALLLGIAGLMPLSDMAESIRIKEKQMSVVTSHSRLIKINFNKLIIFDAEKVSGLTQITKKEEGKSRVIDWVNVRSGCRHDFDCLETDDDFVSKVVFYPTERSDNRKLKDLFAESFLTNEEIKDFSYSDTMVKFKALDVMKKAGIRGSRNGKNPLYPERSTVPYKYYAVKLEPSERKIYRNIITHYKEDPRFEFKYDTIQEAVKCANKPKGYLRKISEKF